MLLFVIDWYSISYRLGRTSGGVGILKHIGEDISPYLAAIEKEHTVIFYAELSLYNERYSMVCSHNPQKTI